MGEIKKKQKTHVKRLWLAAEALQARQLDPPRTENANQTQLAMKRCIKATADTVRPSVDVQQRLARVKQLPAPPGCIFLLLRLPNELS